MAAQRTTPSGARRKRKPVVFLVDDDPALLDLLELSLQGDGYALHKFADAEQALAACTKARTKPDVLVTDYALGRMNGLELAERCKQAQPGLKVVMVSGTASAEIALRSSVKVDGFLGKPYQPSSLSDLVRGVIQGALDVSP